MSEKEGCENNEKRNMAEFALEITEKIAFPRLFGSEGNLKARRIMKEELKKIGYKPKVHTFRYDFSRFAFFKRIWFSFCFVNGCYFLGHLYFSSLFSLLLFPFVLMCTYALVRIFLSIPSSQIKQAEDGIIGENIYAELKGEDQEEEETKERPKIIFVAHHDSKSQRVYYHTRSKILKFFVLLIILTPSVIFFISLLSSIFTIHPTFYFILDSVAFLNLLSMCLLFILIVISSSAQNESPGAIDNGTSVGVIFALNAEEVGIVGSSCFVTDFEEKLDKENSYIINLEMVGLKNKNLAIEKSVLFGILKDDEELNGIIKEIFEEQGGKIIEYDEGMAGSDHLPFLVRGYKATMVCPYVFGKDLKFMHTKEDTLENIDLGKLEESIDLGIKIVQKIGMKYREINEL